MQTFTVLGADGSSYGPADEQTVAQWAREGRINGETQLVCVETGQQLPLRAVASLARLVGTFPAVPTPPAHQTPYPQQPVGYALPAAPVSTAYPQAGYAPTGYPQPAAPYAMGQPLGYALPYGYSAGPHQLTSFSVVGVVLLQWVTCGLFNTIFQNLKHGQLPPRRYDDPSAGKAVGFMFIPFFNLFYWNFFTNLRLCDRINEQRQEAGLPPTAPRGMALAYCICTCIPYVNFISFMTLGPIYYAMLQSSVNELVVRTRGPGV